MIPIGSHLCQSLRDYRDSSELSRDHRANFFARKNGSPIQHRELWRSFRTLLRKSGISRHANISRRPRVQDLRRTFAVHCMRAWLGSGKDLREMLPILGAYIGHVNLASTEAYLAVTPERRNAF